MEQQNIHGDNISVLRRIGYKYILSLLKIFIIYASLFRKMVRSFKNTNINSVSEQILN